jgi:hypothetical protein
MNPFQSGLRPLGACRTLGAYHLCWVRGAAWGYCNKVPQVHIIPVILRHLCAFSLSDRRCLCWGGLSLHLIQMLQDLLTAMELADIPLRIMLVDPWIDGL